MSGFIAFVLLITGMGVGTLVCGLLPLSLSLSHRIMRLLEVFGAGLLVGAAVTVVIPEGSSALFSNVTPAPAGRSASSNAFVNVLHPPSAFSPAAPIQALQAAQQAGVAQQEGSWAWSFITKRSEDDHDHESEHDHDHDNEKPFTQSDAEHRLGSSILLGIVLMYVIDQFTSGANSSSSTAGKAEDNSSSCHHHHHNEYPAPPQRPRLETHRLSKSFHQKTDRASTPSTLHKVSSKASFTVFDCAQHGITEDDEEARIGTADIQDGSTRDPHRRIHSTATSSSNSDSDLPADYDDHDQHADLKHLSSSHGAATADWHASPRSSTTLHRDANHDSSSAGAPLLHRHNSFTSASSRRTHSGSSSSFSQALTTVVGLLIHATADGIAMGASAQSRDQTLTMVVFVAIMVHKAPAAFGLCAMLMSLRLSRTSIRKAVALFAFASPLGAILTYGLLALFFDSGVVSATDGGAEAAQGGIDEKSIGTALAFSGGTFLFVAFHAVLELAGVEADTVPKQGEDGGETQILGKWLRIGLLIAGSCTPRLLQSILAGLDGGGHHH
ncbi:related to ATX2-Golgi membrane protein involved in manganese homeostasis [Ustilago bromivora]|uniref:Related to ATX2 - Golgi membrane protein involved in manganese homeostasis n=1 Tax=Ustilago bromivora TaxID=307758 RepID=A0A1K0GV86_9BASI|nr:related to ATX2-Golgi membrane protein involved in manganese homeostasis [Ustilago bromivora]SYW78431.1 related to ATX2 - Golgi membrane protein involved in manganese homeostasis [Ustilago bromivora]